VVQEVGHVVGVFQLKTALGEIIDRDHRSGASIVHRPAFTFGSNVVSLRHSFTMTCGRVVWQFTRPLASRMRGRAVVNGSEGVCVLGLSFWPGEVLSLPFDFSQLGRLGLRLLAVKEIVIKLGPACYSNAGSRHG
jgi:hypothetical protein